MALSCVLLIGGGLLLRSIFYLVSIEFEFQTASLDRAALPAYTGAAHRCVTQVFPQRSTTAVTRDPDNARSYLPLRPVELEVLLSLSNGERHGYAILQEAEKRSGSETMPGLVTFYRALRRMESDGLIAESDTPAGPDDDERRRYYRISDLGRRVAAAEARRMATLVRAARSSNLIGEGEPAG